MRKHFLLLFLMALLPLSTWAQGQGIDISHFPLTLGSVSYTYTAATPNITSPNVTNTSLEGSPEITQEGNWDLVYYAKSGEDYIEVAADQLATAVKNVGTYAVAAKGKGAYTGTTAKVEFNITPVKVTVSYDQEGITNQTPAPEPSDKSLAAIFYGEAIPTPDASKLYYKGFLGSDTKSVVNTTEFKWTPDKLTASADKEGTALNNVDPTNLVMSGLTATNYEFEYKKVTLRIKQIELKNDLLTVPANKKNYLTITTNKKGAKAFIYNAEEQVPEYTITYIDRQGNSHALGLYQAATATTAASGEYNVTYKKKGLGSSDTYSTNYDQTVKDAAWYKGKINAVEGGNYSGSIELAEADFQYKIAKKGITVYVKPMPVKVYNGTAIDVTCVDIAAGGTSGSFDEGDDIDVTGAEVVCPVLASDVTLKQNIKVHFANAEYNKLAYTDAQSTQHPATTPKNAGEYGLVPYFIGDGLGNNYEAELIQVGSYTIAQRPVKVTALDQTFTYNGKKQTLNTDKTAATYKAEGITGNTDSGVVSGEENDFKALFSIALKEGVEIKETNNAAYAGAILVKVDQDAVDASNYTIQAVNGNVIVEGQKLFVIAPTFDEEYGYEVSADDLKPLLNVNNVTLNGTPEYTIVDANDAEKTYQIGDLLPRGTYTVSIVQTSVKAPTNYSIDRFEDGTITIGKKTLKVKVLDQTLIKAQEEAKLLQGLDYIEFIDGTGLVRDEKIKFTIKGNGSTFSTTAVNENGIANAITAELTNPTPEEANAKTYSNDNYTFTVVTMGKLYVVAENTLVLWRVKKENQGVAAVNTAAALIDQNNNLANATVKILYNDDDDYNTFNANQWYAMVLPFETDVKSISTAFGYAVVDVVRASNTDKNRIYFDLKMDKDKIPANTPFIVKAWDDINMKTTGVNFTGVTIKKPVPGTTAAPNGNLIAADAAGNQFIGTYTGIIGFGGSGSKDYWFSLANGEYKQPSSTAYLRQMSAYIKIAGDAAAHEIIIEELGGQTTVIRSVNAETQVFNGEGWYNLNGVKIEGVPTQKGIYINNGKKVVIK